jgi:hypothetical protein
VSSTSPFGGADVVETLQALIDRRRAELEAQAFSLGRRIYRDDLQAFTRRIRGYWKARRHEPESVAWA